MGIAEALIAIVNQKVAEVQMAKQVNPFMMQIASYAANTAAAVAETGSPIIADAARSMRDAMNNATAVVTNRYRQGTGSGGSMIVGLREPDAKKRNAAIKAATDVAITVGSNIFNLAPKVTEIRDKVIKMNEAVKDLMSAEDAVIELQKPHFEAEFQAKPLAQRTITGTEKKRRMIMGYDIIPEELTEEQKVKMITISMYPFSSREWFDLDPTQKINAVLSKGRLLKTIGPTEEEKLVAIGLTLLGLVAAPFIIPKLAAILGIPIARLTGLGTATQTASPEFAQTLAELSAKSSPFWQRVAMNLASQATTANVITPTFWQTILQKKWLLIGSMLLLYLGFEHGVIIYSGRIQGLLPPTWAIKKKDLGNRAYAALEMIEASKFTCNPTERETALKHLREIDKDYKEMIKFAEEHPIGEDIASRMLETWKMQYGADLAFGPAGVDTYAKESLNKEYDIFKSEWAGHESDYAFKCETSGSILLSIKPPGSTFRILGVVPQWTTMFPEQTKWLIEEVRPDWYQLEVKRDGYETRIEKFEVTAGIEKPVSVTLKEGDAVTGTLIVDTYPEGASVYINGQYAGKTHFEDELAVAKYILRVELRSYEPVEEEIEIFEGVPTPKTYTLTPLVLTLRDINLAYVTIIVENTPAHLLVDGSAHPYPSAVHAVELTEGTHEIELRAKGYAVFGDTIDVKAGELYTFRYTMTQEVAPPPEKPNAYEVTVTSVPTGARIFVNDYLWYYPTPTIIILYPNVYTFKGELKGYESDEVLITLKEL